MARGRGYQLFLTSEGITMVIREDAAGSSTIKMKLTGSRPWQEVTGLDPTGGVSNYLHGTDVRNSLNGIPNFARVRVAGVYDGVDLVLYDHDGDLEYDFVVGAGADPKRIQWAFQGTERMRIDRKSGDLYLTTARGSQLRQVRPTVYQEAEGRRVEVAGGYKLLDGGRAAFTVAPYDHRRPLVIDPTVAFTRFLAGELADEAHAVAVDTSRNAYVTGSTWSEHFPLYQAYLPNFQDCEVAEYRDCKQIDGFVTKLDSNGVLLFSTYIGSGWGNGIAVDSTGVYVTGRKTPGEDPDAPGAGVFVLKLSLTGSPIFNRYFGGGTYEEGKAIALDSQHSAWVTGTTSSVQFAGPSLGSSDVFVLKVGAQGDLLFGGRWGGSDQETGYAITVDLDDEPWVTGGTCSANFPVTSSFASATGRCPVFVLELNRDGSLQTSTVFGGSNIGDIGQAIVANGGHAAYIAGSTFATNFPTTVDAYQAHTTATFPTFEAFLTEIDFSGKIVHSTLLGAADGYTDALTVTHDYQNNVYVGGFTSSTNFPGTTPLTPNPTAGFVSKFKYNLSELYWSKLLGARVYGIDVVKPPAASSVPEIYAAGYRITGGTNPDAFVVKLNDNVAQSQVLWHNPATGELAAWTLDELGRVTGIATLTRPCGTSDGCAQDWKVIGTLDINQDGVGDVLLYNATTGEIKSWLLNSSGAVIGTQSLSRRCGASDGCSQTWKPAGIGDFNKDGIADVLWHNDATGYLQAWLLTATGDVGGTMALSKRCAIQDGCWTTWKIVGIADFDDDGIDDLFWYNTKTGQINVGMMDPLGNQVGTQWLAKVCGPADGCSNNWKPVGIADVNRDGRGDLLWENIATGELQAWMMNGTDRILGTQSLSMRCDSGLHCSLGSIPVGILRNVTP